MDKNKKSAKKQPKQTDSPHMKITMPPSSQDPLGSYTGNPIYPDQTPTQDADDL